MDRPIILCGLGRVGWDVLECLRQAGLPVVVVDTCCTAADPRLAGVTVVHGDCRQEAVLRQAGVEEAGGVLIVTSNDLLNISTALMVRRLNPTVRVVLRMFNQNLVSRLGKAVHNIYALSTSKLAAPLLALTALTGETIGAFGFDDGTAGRWQVARVVVGPALALRSRTVADVAAHYDVQVLAHRPEGGVDRHLTDVDGSARLHVGDRLVVCGPPRQVAPLLGLAAGAATGVLWGGWLRQTRRMLRHAWDEVEWPVKLATALLLAVVVLSTLGFTVANRGAGVMDALFRTISLLIAGDDLGLAASGSPGLKAFVSVLRVAGTGLVAAFTALLTNYLLRARLGGALEVRRIPEGGHVIVCGLGNVGFRVVEELTRAGQRVVVIEPDRNGRFVTTARRLGAAVLQGDATVAEVLRQANAAAARAVIAATSEDLVNLEVALLVRELDPNLRVVLRMADPRLAQTLREAADVRLAMSVSGLAAPAFVAALFGDRVQSVFLVGDRMLAALEMVVQPEDAHLIGESLRAVTVDYRMLLVAERTADGGMRRPAAGARLEAGQRLIAVIALSDLERLVRGQAPPREWAVDVTSFSIPARDWVTLLVRTQRGLGAEEAEAVARELPGCVGTELTRGQAEDLLARMARERVGGRLRKVTDSPPAPPAVRQPEVAPS